MNFIPPDKEQKLEAAYRAGLSIRSAAQFADVAKGTARKYFRAYPPMDCPCGRRLPHRGWCSYRVAKSPKRQAILARIAPLKQTTLARWRRESKEIDAALEGSC